MLRKSQLVSDRVKRCGKTSSESKSGPVLRFPLLRWKRSLIMSLDYFLIELLSILAMQWVYYVLLNLRRKGKG